MEIVFTFNIKENQEVALKEAFPAAVFQFNKKALDAEVETAQILVTYGTDLDEEIIHRAKKLKWIMVASAGVEMMPLETIAARGILVTNARGIHKIPMAESVLAHILALKRAIIPMYLSQQKSEWQPKHRLSELKGSTALILGPGAIGSEIGRLLQAFGVQTIGCNRSGVERPSMDETIVFNNLLDKLPEADFVISVLPSTEDTKLLIRAEHYEAMKETAVFMNFGRGDLLNESELIKALENEVIGHAVLDVFQVEPLPADSPFWSLTNCTVSPHASSYSGKYVERCLEIFHENLGKWMNEDSEFVNEVNLQQGY